VLWLVHESDYGLNLALSNPSVMEALRKADRVVFPSHATRALYRSFARGNHFSIPCGVELPAGEPPLVRHPSTRLQLLHVGSLERRKGPDLLVKAFLQLEPELQREVELHFLGRVLDRALYLQLVESTARFPNVHWLGEVSHEETRRWMQRCDAFVCTSRDETGPLVVMEAMAVGKPILTTPVGLMPEIIVPGQNGYLLESSEPEAIARGLRTLVEERAALSRMGVEARKTVAAGLTVEHHGKAIGQMIAELLKDPPPRKRPGVAATRSPG
jgi:glycosyltransferase involved in cell wall biosynthesis